MSFVFTLVLCAGTGAPWQPHWSATAPTPTLQARSAEPTSAPRRVALNDKAWTKLFEELKTHYLMGQLEQVLTKAEDLEKRDLTDAQRIMVLRYQAFALFLMKSTDIAADVWREILAIDPNYRLNVDEVSPEFLEFFRSIHGPHEHAPGETHDHHHDERGGHRHTAHPAPPGQASSDERTTTKDTEIIHAQPAPSTAVSPPDEALATVQTERGCGIALCLLPGGVGQYANGQWVKGIIFSVLQATALGLNLGMYWGPNLGDPDAQLAIQRTALVSLVALIGLGIADAFLFY